MSSRNSAVRPDDRMRVLEAHRQAKMSESAHAYVRGNTIQFYQWMELNSAKSVPEGPPVWICGDCHVGNIGPLADSNGKVEIQIRALDQTVIGNPAHDLIRLALSLATAARGSDLSGITAVKMLEQMIDGYEQALVAPRKTAALEDGDLDPIQAVLDQSRHRRWHHLAEERIKDVTPQIPLGEKFWALREEERAEIDELFQDDAIVSKVTSFKGRDTEAKLTVLDAAYWMKGCSSLGRLRYAVLLSVGKKKDQQYCLIDLKEATKAAAPRTEGKLNQNDAQRVVTGACNLSPNLGERMMAVTIAKKPIVLRELMPQDLKFDLDRLTKDEAIAAARYLAGVVGKAHGQQMDRTTRAAWQATLRKRRSKSLDAPG